MLGLTARPSIDCDVDQSIVQSISSYFPKSNCAGPLQSPNPSILLNGPLGWAGVLRVQGRRTGAFDFRILYALMKSDQMAEKRKDLYLKITPSL